MRLLALAALAGCYSAPSNNTACTLLCDDACPGEMSCVNGFCVGEGQHCEPTFTQIAAGNGFVCALDNSGRRWCWGANDQHQLDPSSRQTLMYATLVDDGPWDVIASGGDHACGLREGALLCWGGNDRQQVSGTISGDVDQPLRIDAPNRTPWTSIATGYATTCGIAGGKLYCWGANNRGQTGAGSSADVGAPAQVGNLSDWSQVAIGRDHACGVSASAGLMCWGYNYYGQLGDGSALAMDTPKLPVPVALPNVTSVALAGSATCAVSNGQLFCWGRASSYLLGDPVIAVVDPCVGATSTPIAATTLDGWTQLTASRTYVCGLRAGELFCWGSTPSGLGVGVWGGSAFVKIADGASAVTTGWNTAFDDTGGETDDLDVTCFIVNGAIQCWGDNRYGQLAQGAATMAPQPVEIAGSHRWANLEAGESTMCGIDTAGAPWCWGTNAIGQLDGVASGNNSVHCGPSVTCAAGTPMPPPFATHADAIKVGDEHTCLLDAGQITCWGTNSQYQLGGAGAMSPAMIAGAWTSMYTVGGRGQCAVQNGQTYCWGTVIGFRQTPAHDARLDGMNLMGVTAQIGDTTGSGNQRAHGCLLDGSNRLACFGVNTHGQFGNGAPTKSCGNGNCEIGEDASCSDCNNQETCTTDSCGDTYCGARCNDGYCSLGLGETCSNCAADCGNCQYSQIGRTYETIAVSSNSGYGYTCGIRVDGQIECWGRNNYGQAGALDGSGKLIDPVFTPILVAGLANCTAASAGGNAACAVCGGDIYCWGSHRTGAVGAGPVTAYPITEPRQVDIPLDDGDHWVQLVSGEGFNCARSEAGRGYCWGFHARGALGIGATSMNLPVAIKTQPAESR